MNFGDYSGTYKSKVFKSLLTFFDITIEGLSKLTGFTESHLEGILRQDNIEKPMGKRLLSSMNLTNNDYDWIDVVLSEIAFDHMVRVRQLDEIRYRQRQLAIDKKAERVKKDDKESSKETKRSKRVKDRRGSSKEDKGSKVINQSSSNKGVEISKEIGVFKESGDKNRKAIKKRSKGEDKGNKTTPKENNVSKRKGKSK